MICINCAVWRKRENSDDTLAFYAKENYLLQTLHNPLKLNGSCGKLLHIAETPLSFFHFNVRKKILQSNWLVNYINSYRFIYIMMIWKWIWVRYGKKFTSIQKTIFAHKKQQYNIRNQNTQFQLNTRRKYEFFVVQQYQGVIFNSNDMKFSCIFLLWYGIATFHFFFLSGKHKHIKLLREIL